MIEILFAILFEKFVPINVKEYIKRSGENKM